MAVDGSQHLLDLLQAHGQQFLKSFDITENVSSSNKRKRDDGLSPKKFLKDDFDNEEEWGGIQEDEDITEASTNQDESSEYGDDVFDQKCDASNAEPLGAKTKVVVFQDIHHPPKAGSKAGMKAFMSSKIGKLRQDFASESNKREENEDDQEDDRTNVQNDAILHRLIHTKLLAGSLDPELDQTPAQRRKSLAGRVLELSGDAKLGKGENSVREKERNKASKRVREGLLQKQKERRRQELEEAKDIGNYHPTLKKLFDPSEDIRSKKRERGLRMGVGKFKGGILTLSQADVARAQGGPPTHNRGATRSNRGGGNNRKHHKQ